MIPLMLSFSLMLLASNSTTIINKYAEIGHLCLIPCFGWNHSEKFPLLITADVQIYLMKLLPKLKAYRLLSINVQLIESNAFSMSTFNNIPGWLFLLVNMVIS